MNSVVLLIGGNEGDRELLIEQATEQIRERIGSVVALSSVYETEPWGEFEIENSKLKIENFLNRALLVATTLSPWQVLRTALAIEKDLGRQRPQLSTFNFPLSTKKYHSRPMDIDLIFYDNLVIDTPELTLPHPRMHLRRFVLEPLAEIIPDFRHPVTGKTVLAMLEECKEPPKGVPGIQAGVITPEVNGTQAGVTTPEKRTENNLIEPPKGVKSIQAGVITPEVNGTQAGVITPEVNGIQAGVITPEVNGIQAGVTTPEKRTENNLIEPPKGVKSIQAGVTTPEVKGVKPLK